MRYARCTERPDIRHDPICKLTATRSVRILLGPGFAKLLTHERGVHTLRMSADPTSRLTRPLSTILMLILFEMDSCDASERSANITCVFAALGREQAWHVVDKDFHASLAVDEFVGIRHDLGQSSDISQFGCTTHRLKAPPASSVTCSPSNGGMNGLYIDHWLPFARLERLSSSQASYIRCLNITSMDCVAPCGASSSGL